MSYKLLTVDRIPEETDYRLDAYSLGMKEIEVSKETYDSAIQETSDWIISITHDNDYDGGGSWKSHEQNVRQEEINPESIVVKDGKFVGCYFKFETSFFNKVVSHSVYHCILFTNGTHVSKNYEESSFSSDDHERSNTYTYSLKKK